MTVYIEQFMEFDEDHSGDIGELKAYNQLYTITYYSDIMELKRMMEKMGQAKTHLELKKMIAEVDTNNSGVYLYNRNKDMHAYI